MKNMGRERGFAPCWQDGHPLFLCILANVEKVRELHEADHGLSFQEHIRLSRPSGRICRFFLSRQVSSRYCHEVPLSPP